MIEVVFGVVVVVLVFVFSLVFAFHMGKLSQVIADFENEHKRFLSNIDELDENQ